MNETLKKVLLIQAKVDLEVMAMMRYSIPPSIALELKPHYQTQFSV